MKKIIFVILLLIPLNVFAYIGPLDTDSFYVNNQTSSPFNFTIPSNGTTNVTFDLVWDWYHGNSSNLDLPGSYLFISILSDKKIDIQRRYAFNQYCNISCFSTDDYLQLIDDSNGYSYVYYFNILKWSRNIGTQVDIFSVSDYITFTNLESGQATVYLYGAYADTTNQIPQYINNANTTQQIIIDGQTNTDWIIDNQNQNTQDIIDNLKNCHQSVNLINVSEPKLVSNATYQVLSNGIIVVNSIAQGYSYLAYDLGSNGLLGKQLHLHFNANSSSTFSPQVGIFYANSSCGSLSNGTYLRGTGVRDLNFTVDSSFPSGKTNLCLVVYSNNNSSLSVGDYVQYADLQVEIGNQFTQYEPYGQTICTNKIDDTTSAVNDVNNSINNLNDSINNSGIDNPNNDFSDMEDLIAQNGVITNLIALPITLYSALLSGLNQSCSTYNFGSLFGSDLKFQCINLGALLGNTIWGVIDVLFSGFTIYAIAKKMIKVFNNFSGLNEGDVIDD